MKRGHLFHYELNASSPLILMKMIIGKLKGRGDKERGAERNVWLDKNRKKRKKITI